MLMPNTRSNNTALRAKIIADPATAAGYAEQARARGLEVDTPEQVADKILELINSEAPEVEM